MPAGLPQYVPVSPLEPLEDFAGGAVPSGNFTIRVNGTTITLQSQLTGLDPSTLGSVALHEGPLCSGIGEQLASPITGETPWDSLPTFESDSNGDVAVLVAAEGFPLSSIMGRTLVVRDASGEHMACGAIDWVKGAGTDFCLFLVDLETGSQARLSSVTC